MDTGCFDGIMSIHEIKIGSYRQIVVGLEIGSFLVLFSRNSPSLLYINQNDVSLEVEWEISKSES